MTFSKVDLNVTLRITIICHHAECRVLFMIMLSVIMPVRYVECCCAECRSANLVTASYLCLPWLLVRRDNPVTQGKLNITRL
jgi:hypothetical protein